MVTAVRRWPREKGLGVEWSDADVLALIAEAARQPAADARQGPTRFSIGRGDPFTPGGDPAAQRAAAEAKPDVPVTTLPMAGSAGASTEDLRPEADKKMKAWFGAGGTLVGGVVNSDTGRSLRVGGSSRRKMRWQPDFAGGDGLKQDHARALSVLPDLIRHAVRVRTHHEESKQDVVAVHRFVAPLQLEDGPMYRVKLTVHERQSGEWVYAQHLTEMDPLETSEAPRGVLRGDSGVASAPSPGASSVAVRDLLRDGSPKDFVDARFSLGDAQAGGGAPSLRDVVARHLAGLDTSPRPDLANPGASEGVRRVLGVDGRVPASGPRRADSAAGGGHGARARRVSATGAARARLGQSEYGSARGRMTRVAAGPSGPRPGYAEVT